MAEWDKGGWDDGKGGPPGYDPYMYQQWEEDDEEKFTKTQANVDKIIIVLGLFVCAALLGPLLSPVGWNQKATHIWTIYIGLHYVETKLDTIAGAAMQAAGQAHDAMAKSAIDSGNWVSLAKLMNPTEPHSIQFMRDQFCNAQLWTFGLLGNVCDIFSWLLYSSWCCQLGHVAAIALIFFGTLLMCMKPKKCARWSAVLCYFIAFLALAGGLVLYAFASYKLSDLFVGEMLSNAEFTLSICPLISALLCILILLLPGVLFTCGRWPRKGHLHDDDSYTYDDSHASYGQATDYDPYAKGAGWDDGKGGKW